MEEKQEGKGKKVTYDVIQEKRVFPKEEEWPTILHVVEAKKDENWKVFICFSNTKVFSDFSCDVAENLTKWMGDEWEVEKMQTNHEYRGPFQKIWLRKGKM